MDTPEKPIVAAGRNCWRIEHASEAAVIVDAADYYRIIADAMEKAHSRIFIVGWDFDARISLAPDREGSYHSSLGHFFIELARKKPDRVIDILKWNFGALKQWFWPKAAYWLLRWWLAKPIRLKFDSSHPLGCSHHQKIVVIDESLAACGGIDIAMRRWDTRDHKPDDPCRKTPNGKPYQPWHDTTMLMRGKIAGALGDLGRERWKVATSEELDPIEDQEDDWPDELDPMFEDVEIAIARTRASYKDLEEVRENEQLFLDMIEQCQRFAYIENQYFTSPKIAAAICTRLSQPNPPEIVMIMPRNADGWLESVAMDGTRQRLMQAIQRQEGGENFRIYVPVNEADEDIYVHAKVAIIDDRFVRVGSSNLNNRSMGLDSECDVIVDCGLPHNRGRGLEEKIRRLRHDLLAEHLGVEIEEVAKAEDENRGLVQTIEALKGEGKTLTLLEYKDLTDAEHWISDHELLDPEHTDEMFEPMQRKRLSQRWRRTRKRLKGWFGR